MATPLFPASFTETSQRALDADLYSTIQHSADADNIAASGNLNIGKVIDYDAAVENNSGGTMRADNSEELPETFSVPSSAAIQETPASENAPLMQTNATATNPSIASPSSVADSYSAYNSNIPAAAPSANEATNNNTTVVNNPPTTPTDYHHTKRQCDDDYDR